MTFDEARAAYPAMAFCVSAFDPGGTVTLETIMPDQRVFQFTGPTLQAALDLAFPPAPEPQPINVFE